MKLGNLIELHNQMIMEIDKQWDILINAAVANQTNMYPKDKNTYAVPLTAGEMLLSKIIQKYDQIDEISFYIYDTKNRVKIPELGISISCAEQELGILNHKLFNHQKLGRIISEIEFKIVEVDTKTNNVGIEFADLNKGFDLKAIDETIAYLTSEIKKYETFISKTIWATEVVLPFPEEKQSNNFTLTNLQSQMGTLKTQIETPQPAVNTDTSVDISEYVAANNYIAKRELNNRTEPIPQKIASQKPVFHNCPVCQSPYRDIIENTYMDTQGDMLKTLQFASSSDGLATLSPNTLLNHLDNHKNKPIRNQANISNPEKHLSSDHSSNPQLSNNQSPIINYSKIKNIAIDSFDPDKHQPIDHAV